MLWALLGPHGQPLRLRPRAKDSAFQGRVPHAAPGEDTPRARQHLPCESLREREGEGEGGERERGEGEGEGNGEGEGEGRGRGRG